MTILPAQSDLQMRTEYEAMGAHLNRNSTRSQTELDRSWRTGRPPNDRFSGSQIVNCRHWPCSNADCRLGPPGS